MLKLNLQHFAEGVQIEYNGETNELPVGKQARFACKDKSMPSDIVIKNNGVGEISGVTVTKDKVLEGEVFYGSNGLEEGTMPNNGYVDGDFGATLDSNLTKLLLNGAYRGSVVINPQEVTIVPSNNDQEISPAEGHVFSKIKVEKIPPADEWDGTGVVIAPSTEPYITINGTRYDVISGMTWWTWANNLDYNTDNFRCTSVDSKVFEAESDNYIVDSNGRAVLGDEVITVGGSYSIKQATFNFTIGVTIYSAETEMTWFEWVKSNYAPDSYTCSSTESKVKPTGDTYIVDSNGNAVLGKDYITVGGEYSIADEETTKTFTIAGKSYDFEEGMTWYEWVRSNYSPDSYTCVGDGSRVKPTGDTYIVDRDGNAVYGRDFISEGGVYSIAKEIVINSFTINGATYKAIEGMTWWIWAQNSEYNTDNFRCASVDSKIFEAESNNYVVDRYGKIMLGDEIITAGGVYTIKEATFSFTVGTTTFTADADMTWIEWVGGNYAPDSYSCLGNDSKVKPTGDTYIVDSNGNTVYGRDLITVGGTYAIKEISFSFRVDGKTYIAETEMTWFEWVKSNYAPDSYTCSSTESKVKPTGDTYIVDSNGNAVLGKDYITVGGEYSIADEETTKTFTIAGKSYDFEEGMTWYEWVRSNYSPDSYTCVGDGSRVKPTGDTYIVDRDGNAVYGRDFISEGGVYSIKEGA